MILENLRIGLTSLLANKLRAALTMLGIMIGVAAVITLLSIGDGVTRFIAEQFSGLGSNLVFIIPQQEAPGPPGSDPLSESSLTLRDGELLSDSARVPGAAFVSPAVLRGADLQYGGQVHNLLLRASTPDYSRTLNWPVGRGVTFFSETEYNGRSRVVILRVRNS